MTGSCDIVTVMQRFLATGPRGTQDLYSPCQGPVNFGNKFESVNIQRNVRINKRLSRAVKYRFYSWKQTVRKRYN